MRVRRRPAEAIGLQIAPMCDVVFLILAFFMLTTQLTNRDRLAPVRLPVASAAAESPAGAAGDRFPVTLDAKGALFVGREPVDAAALRERLRARFRDHPPLKVYLRADAAVPARRIKEIVAWSAQAGAVEIVLGTTEEGR